MSVISISRNCRHKKGDTNYVYSLLHKLTPYVDITNSAETESRATESKFVATYLNLHSK